MKNIFKKSVLASLLFISIFSIVKTSYAADTLITFPNPSNSSIGANYIATTTGAGTLSQITYQGSLIGQCSGGSFPSLQGILKQTATGIVIATSSFTGVICSNTVSSTAIFNFPSIFVHSNYGMTLSFYAATSTSGCLFDHCASTNLMGLAGGGYGSATEFFGKGNINVPSISMYFPSASTASSSIPDFSYWQVYLTSNYNSNANIQVSYSRSPDNLFSADTFSNSYAIDSRIGSAAPLGFGRNTVLKTRPLESGLWYVQASYIDIDNFFTTSTAISSFTISSSSAASFPLFPGSEDSYGPTAGGPNAGVYQQIFQSSGCYPNYSCNDTDTGFWNGLGCNLIYAISYSGSFLVCPADSSVNFIKGSIENFKTVPPFSVVFDIVDDATGQIATSTFSDLEININTGQGSETLPITLLSSDSPINSNSARSGIFDAMRIFIWLGAVASAVKMITLG